MRGNGTAAGRRVQALCATCTQSGQCAIRALAGTDSAVRCRVLHRGEPVFRAGARLDEIHMLRCGAVKTRVCSKGGQERVLGLHASGEMLGLDALATGTHACDAVALDTVSTCALPAARISAGQGAGTSAVEELLCRASEALAEQQRHVLLLGRPSAEQRIAGFLVQRSRRQQKLGLSARRIHLTMARADIASYLALAVETVSRVLTRLQAAGVLTVERNEVDIVDFGRLLALADSPCDASAHQVSASREAPPEAQAERYRVG